MLMGGGEKGLGDILLIFQMVTGCPLVRFEILF
jgi:hypothetical protein